MKALLHAVSTTFCRVLLQGGYATVSTYLPALDNRRTLITLPSVPEPVRAAVNRMETPALYVRPSCGRPPRRLASS